MKKQYNSPATRSYSVAPEAMLAISLTMDSSQTAEQWSEEMEELHDDWDELEN